MWLALIEVEANPRITRDNQRIVAKILIDSVNTKT